MPKGRGINHEKKRITRKHEKRKKDGKWLFVWRGPARGLHHFGGRVKKTFQKVKEKVQMEATRKGSGNSNFKE